MPFADIPPVPPEVPVEVAVTAESVTVSGAMKMGLAGLHYRRALAPHWYGGISVYGATHGDRGGFFAWGLSSGYRLRQGPWAAEAGLFLGGGGGSPAWVGGGLMWRPHAEVSYAWGDLSLGVGVSQVRLPSGVVNSTQPYAGLAWRSHGLFGAAGRSDDEPVQRWASQALPREYVALAGQYSPRRPPRRDGTGGTPNLRFGGAAMRRALSGSFAGAQPYWLISAAGAMGGGYDGYAELMGGVGAQYALPFYPALTLRVEGALGSGGAGATVDTGGGLLRKASGGVAWQPTRHLGVAAMAGRVESRGRFSASELRLELALHGWDVVPGERRAQGSPPSALAWSPWAFSTSLLQYPRLQRDDGTTRGAGLLALKLERELDASWRVVGQAATAVSGNAGGYATGHLGVGWLSAPLAAVGGWRLGGEATLGAAGGGGVLTGGGLFGQAQLQARHALSPDWSVQADAGWLRNRKGTLSSAVLGVGLVHSFSLLQSR